MGGWLNLVFIILLVTSALGLIFFAEVHETYLSPLKSDFTTEGDLDTWSDLFMSVLIPVAIFISCILWYITRAQARRHPGGGYP